MKRFLKISVIAVASLILVPILLLSLYVGLNFLSKDPDATYELRGRYKLSDDRKTYLVIEDDNGGECGPLYVDKKIWRHALSEKGEVSPGEHSIECGTEQSVEVKQGTTYYFNYWGP